MRIIKEKTLHEYIHHPKYSRAKNALTAWIYEIRSANWKNANELKIKFGNASVLNTKRVIFNINGNEFRLVVDIEYKLQIVFIIWFGSHKEYDKVDAKNIKYEK